MKKITKKAVLLVLILALTLSLAGCSQANNITKSIADGIKKGLNTSDKNQKSDKIIKDKDNKYQLSIPSSWKEDNELNQLSILQVSNRVQEKYAMVIGEENDSFSNDATIDDYASLVKEGLGQTVQNIQISKDENITINSKPAKYFEVQGEVQKLKISYMFIITEDSENFFQIIGWTLAPRFEANKQEIRTVMESFQEVK